MDENQFNADELRSRAEVQLGENRGTTHLFGTEDEKIGIHELQVYQIELEMQNAELRQTRDDLEEMLEKYSDLFDFAPVGYVTLNRDGIVQTVNFAGAALLGSERSRLHGRLFGQFIVEEYHSVFADFLGIVFTGNGINTCEVALLKAGNVPLIVQIEGRADEAGQECRLALIDITERKRMEEQTAHLASFPRLNPNPVLEVDLSGLITFFNPATMKILKTPGMDEADITAFIPSDMKDIIKNWDRLNDVALYREITIKSRIFAETVFLTSQSNSVRIYANDITERKQADELLHKMNEELESLVEERTAELRMKDDMLLVQGRQAAMGEMIGNIAHQWRQPLNILGLMIQSQMMYYDHGEFTRELLKETVDESMRLIQHMSSTIDDFRNFFKPDKEKVDFKLSDVIAITMSFVEESFKNQRIRIEVIAKNDPVVNGYMNELAQVMLNILNNARDALLEKEIKDARVTITVCTVNGRAVVTISDNAGGIPEEIIEKIFDPYFTTKGPQEGTGVGLFMSKSIIEKSMDGRLTARNTDDGAEFRIELNI